MADHGDVMDLLEKIARDACSPGGVSVTGRAVTVAQGWPQAADMDAALRAGNSVVSVYSEPSSTSATVTPINSSYVLTPPTTGTTVEYDDVLVGSITVGGSPRLGDAIFVSLGRHAYSYVVVDGDTVSSVAAKLLGLVLPDYPDATLSGNTLLTPSAVRIFAAVSGVGQLATKIHSARTQYMIVVWAPNPSDRQVLAEAIELSVKDVVRWPLADSTCVIVSWQGTNLRDKEEMSGAFRRDVIVNATYETIKVTKAQQVVGVKLQGASQ